MRSSLRSTALGLAATGLAVSSLIAGGIAAPERAAAESLVEAVEHAVNFHPEMRRDRAFNRAAEKFVDENYAGYLPRLDLDIAMGGEVTNSPTTRAAGFSRRTLARTDVNANLTQMLFDGFETQNAVAAARFESLASSKTLVATGETVGIEAVGAYLDVLEARERLVVAEEDQAELSRLAGLVADLVNAGRASRVDNDQTVSRVSFSESELAQAQGAARTAAARYTEIVGKAPGPLFRPDEPQFVESSDLDAAIAVALSENPQAMATAATLDARKADVEAARAPYAPRIDLEINGGVDSNQDGTRGFDKDVSVLLRLRWNLFNGFGDLARVRAATFDTQAAAKEDGETRRLVREAVRVSFLELQTARERLEPLRGDAIAARQVYDAYLEQFDIGTRSLLDLLDARNDLTDSELALVSGEFDVLEANYDLLFAMGRLLRTLDIVVEPGDADRHDLQSVDAGGEFALGNLATALGMWSDGGTWLGEDSESPVEAALEIRAHDEVRTEAETAEVDTMPVFDVAPRQRVRSLNQMAETEVAARSRVVAVKRQVDVRELPITATSEIAEPRPIRAAEGSAGPARDSRDEGPGRANYLRALESLAETVLGLEPSVADGYGEPRGAQVESLAELPAPEGN